MYAFIHKKENLIEKTNGNYFFELLCFVQYSLFTIFNEVVMILLLSPDFLCGLNLFVDWNTYIIEYVYCRKVWDIFYDLKSSGVGFFAEWSIKQKSFCMLCCLTSVECSFFSIIMVILINSIYSGMRERCV